MFHSTMSHTSRISALATAKGSSALRAFIFGILAAILLGLVAVPATANIPAEEREALLALYQNTSGASWKSSSGWLGPWGTERNWYGVVCDASNSTVLQINLHGNGLSGSLPEELGNLTNLQCLVLNGNKVTGTLPESLGRLARLRRLDLSDNAILDGLGDWMGGMSRLTILNLRNNLIEGKLPAGLGRCANLTSMDLSSNKISGTIPPEFGDLPILQKMDLSHNALDSALPAELSHLRNLYILLLNHNELSGTIPFALGDLGHLQWMDLSHNRLGGNIPVELARLANIKTLSLSDNQLAGPIPSALGDMAALQELDLSHNALAGGIPARLSLAPLTVLDLSDNQLTGAVPAEITTATGLRVLSLEQNKMTGPLTPMIMACEKLESIDLRYNGFTVDDPALVQFVNDRQPEGQPWTLNQTVPPDSPKIEARTSTTMTLAWKPISFVEGPGYYEVYGCASPRDKFSPLGQTASKSDASIVITGLAPNTTYYFVVRTVSLSGGENQNTIISEFSVRCSDSTLDPPVIGRR